jgi:membrane-associated phospholipid phosphatase
MLVTILDYIGINAPLILFFLSVYLLFNKNNLLFFYIIGFFINIILNIVLKGIIKQPRPLDDEKIFNLAIKNNNKDIFKDGIPFDVFGMPSGHAQSVLFSTIYIYLALKKINILLFYVLITLITMFQRIYNNYHSIAQVIVGDIVGALVAFFIFYISQQKIKGIIREKRDDFGPI